MGGNINKVLARALVLAKPSKRSQVHLSTVSTAPLVPPFTSRTAHAKVKLAQDLWNTKNPQKIKDAYTTDCIWRNRDIFIQGHDGIVSMLSKKWQRETNYKLRKELFAFTDNKIAVQFWYEFKHWQTGRWFRCYGLEDWTFDEEGKMQKRQMSGNDVPITENERWFAKGVDVNTVDISEAHW
ncbi:MAG: hypothetical protein MMC33_004366 [Icmadophila ericetorum]|nr:hypothetical protein [Icmadophila ericetorum]